MADPVFSIYNTYISSGTADNTFDIGTALVEFRHLYIDGTANIDQLQVDEGANFADNISITAGTGTGLKIGAATNQKFAFYNATPIVQGAGTVDIRTFLVNFGLIASGGANPLNLNGGLLTAGSATITTLITVATASITGNFSVVGTSSIGNLIFADNRTVTAGTGTGLTVAGATNQKLALWAGTPITQPSTTGETNGFTAGAGTTVTDQSTFTGNVGTTAYRISDIIQALKNMGAIKS